MRILQSITVHSNPSLLSFQGSLFLLAQIPALQHYTT